MFCSILFYYRYVSSCSILFCSVLLFYSVLFCFSVLRSALLCCIPFYAVLVCFTLFSSVLFCCFSVLVYYILFCFVLFYCLTRGSEKKQRRKMSSSRQNPLTYLHFKLRQSDVATQQALLFCVSNSDKH